MASANVKSDTSVANRVGSSTNGDNIDKPQAATNFYRKRIPIILRFTTRPKVKIHVPGHSAIALFMETHLREIENKTANAQECIYFFGYLKPAIIELCTTSKGEIVDRVLNFLEQYFQMQSMLDAVDLELTKLLLQYKIVQPETSTIEVATATAQIKRAKTNALKSSHTTPADADGFQQPRKTAKPPLETKPDTLPVENSFSAL